MIAAEDEPQPSGGAYRFLEPSLRVLSLSSPEAAWAATEAADVPPYFSEPDLTCTSSRALVDGGDGSGLALWELAGGDEWQRPAPNPDAGVLLDVLAADDEFVFIEAESGGAIVYDPAEDLWRPQDDVRLQVAGAVVAEDRIVGWPVDGGNQPVVSESIDAG